MRKAKGLNDEIIFSSGRLEVLCLNDMELSPLFHVNKEYEEKVCVMRVASSRSNPSFVTLITFPGDIL